MSKGFGGSDFAQQITEREQDALMREVLRHAQEQHERALARRSAGAGDLCEDCGNPIDPKRLRFLPEATRCVDCQSKRDRAC